MDMGPMDPSMNMGDTIMNATTMENDQANDMDPINEKWIQSVYWIAVCAVIAAFMFVNAYSRYLAWQRTRSVGPAPAKPKTWPAIIVASITAMVREVSNGTFGRFTVWEYSIQLPTLGKTLMVSANLAALIALSYYRLGPSNYDDYEDIGYRIGRLNSAQIPILFLLAGKRNIPGWLTGMSYERINWLHRWAARCLLVTVCMHMGYFFMAWGRYDYIGTRIKTDTMTQSGLACFALLFWIVFSSMTPIRGWRYEFFLIQHIISFAGFIGAVYVHIVPTDTEFVWVSVGVFFFDRILRVASYMYNNLFKIRNTQYATGKLKDFWGSKADFFALPGGYTRVSIDTPPASWKPGQHVLLSCQALVPLQAHPFTICSIPSDGKMEFIVQSRTGGTKHLYRHAEKLLPEHRHDAFARKTVAIEGPYGHVRPLQQFDTITFYAGGTGGTFVVPLFRDLVHQWKTGSKVVTRKVRLVWVVKSGKQLEWFREQLNQVCSDVVDLRAQNFDVQIRITVYVTCDETFTSKHKNNFLGESGFITHDHTMDCNPTVVEYNEKNELSDVDSIAETKKAAQTNAPHDDCCCQQEVDEDDPDAPMPICNCKTCGKHSDDSSSDASVPIKPASSWLHPDLHVYSGRPQIKDIMRASVEHALGESAVVACGPGTLIHDVRHATVSLSDERAVHKGTGAQGIWLHTEAFSY